MIQRLGDKIRPWIKVFYSSARYMPGYEHINFTPEEDVSRFDVNNFLRNETEIELLVEIQEQCSHFADELLTLVSKRTIRIINRWSWQEPPYAPVQLLPYADDYPNSFTTFDILSVLFQSMSFYEMSPYLEEAIDGALSSAYDSLSAQEKFFIA